MIQGRPQPGTIPEPGSIFASPQRDIAHAFPLYMRVALQQAEKELESAIAEYDEATAEVHWDYQAERDDLGDLAKKLVRFVDLSYGEISCPDVIDAVDQAGLLGVKYTGVAYTLLTKWVLRVLMGAYHRGARMAYTHTDIPIGVTELNEDVEAMAERAESRKKNG